jgi:diketogulonate reductase-like aldo/keto reductase
MESKLREHLMQAVESNGAQIPVIGLGTWELHGRICARVVQQALRLGYRHIDTAEIYDNERDVGEGLRASGVKRQDVFITTKIWPAHLAPLELERATKESLARLRLTEVDLLLIHWPSQKIPLSETIPALCKMKTAGFTRHIGVSNFTTALLDEAVSLSTEPLVTNQIEWHPFLDQSKVRAACKKHGIAVTAYSPIARGKAAGDKELKLIGLHHRKTAAQVCLRYLIQEGAVVIPRTSKVERLSENLGALDFELNEAEMDEVRKLARPDGRMVTMGSAPDWD